MNDLPLGALFGLLISLILCSGFFSSSETGMMALNRYRLRHMANSGHRSARLTQSLLRRPDRLIGLILLGNNLVNILAASIATIIAIRLLGEAGIWVSTLCLTVVILIFAEVAPKTVAAVHPERIAFPASYVLTGLMRVLMPVVVVINGITNTLLRPLGLQSQPELLERLNLEELRTLFKEGGHLPRSHQKMLVNILDLEQATVDDIMIPRGEIVGIDLDDEWDEILDQLTQTFYTRLPVFRDTIDDVEGFLHIRTVIARLAHGALSRDELERSMRKPYFIPEGTRLTQQLLEFQRRERRMGLVVDEYGDILGLVTLDDILEEIVGEYTTEGRERLRVIRRLEDGNYLVDGAAGVRALNRRMNWDLPEGEARTLNGLLIELLESIPDGKASVRVGDHVMTIVDIHDNMIRKVLVKPLRR